MADFKPGDKVEHPGYGEGTVTYGPYVGYATDLPRALVQFTDSPDRQYEVWVKDLTARPAFKVGDRAMMHDDAEVTIVFGPYSDADGWAGYLIKDEFGEHRQTSADDLSPLPSRRR